MILPSDTIPTYGTLSYVEERTWFENYRWYWTEYIKRAMKDKLATGSDDFINRNWPLMSKEYKAAVWQLMTPDEQQRIRNVRNAR